jgi:hypothetical protein
MTNTPKKIWVLPLWGRDYPQNCRVSEEKEDDDSQEYIRKDTSDARIEQLEEALESISCMGFDMPATLELTDEAWSKRRAGLMQQIAREALMENNK